MRLRSYIYIIILLVIGLFHGLLCNENPLISKSKDGLSFPAFASVFKGRNISANEAANGILYSPIPYSYHYIGSEKPLLPPLSLGTNGRHWLGTDSIGRDVAAAIARGCWISLSLATIATLLSMIIGIFLGMAAGLLGDNGLKVNFLQTLVLLMGCFMAVFSVSYAPQGQMGFSLFVGIFYLLTSLVVAYWARGKMKQYPIPFDALINRILEWLKVIPGLVWILVLMPLIGQVGWLGILTAFVFLGWASFARHTRAEVLSIKEEPYIASIEAEGASLARIALFHVLPNLWTTLRVLSIFVFINFVMSEAALSFLGIGLPVEEMSWGKLMNDGRNHIHAWWLIAAPCLILLGLALFKPSKAIEVIPTLISKKTK